MKRMASMKKQWETGRYVEYDRDPASGVDAVKVTFAGGYEIRGSHGTLIALSDVVNQVVAACEKGTEGVVEGKYRWPGHGWLDGEAQMRDLNHPLTAHNKLDKNDKGNLWLVTIEPAPQTTLERIGRLKAVLDEFMDDKAVEAIEMRAAILA
jgi:hypothetical protein